MSSMSEISQVGLKSVLIIDRLFGRSFPRVAGGHITLACCLAMSNRTKYQWRGWFVQRFLVGQERKTMNGRASANERRILPVMCHNTGNASMMKLQLSLILPTRTCLLRRRRLQHPTGARDAYGTKHQIHLRLPHMTFSCGIWSVEFTSEAGKARSASQNLQRRRITIRYLHVPH